MNHISSSQVRMVHECEMQWYFRYVMNKIAPPGVALVLGSSFDKSVNVNFEQKVKTQEDVKESVVTDAFVQEYHNGIKEADVTMEQEEGESREKYVQKIEDAGLSMVRTFHNGHAKYFMPKMVQAKFTYNLSGTENPWSVLGYIDHISLTVQFKVEETKSGKALLVPTGKLGAKTSVYDNKTATNAPADGEVNKSWQLPNYSLGHYLLTGAYPEKTGLVFTTRPTVKTEPKVVYQERICTSDDTDRLMARYSAAIKTMEALKDGKIEPKGASEGSHLCTPRFCGYWSQCKLRRREL